MKIAISLLIACTLLLGGCVVDIGETPTNAPAPVEAPPEQIGVLSAEGYTDINLGGLPIYGCADSDSMFYNRSFTAKKNGKTVEGVVCGAMFKGYTVRVLKVY